ncbi:D-alanyl-D-alanine carboxypeptidase [Agrilactobacillus composti DSM 18527 = JCM 14202]|uniref:D-alanyl-D-alanine carboxypeptidase n=1 Tax=Agrilactobacillus composti DSM 18527 = JCM 14202 TaxID=1423734 RepID=A0A0R1XLL8_9LACO|nr:D-alanyl-D-alanine carboxypeptidase family protein [Agrilactobacillus composti]KRM31074.1 D-alanyl-D-alanine carboxypeptidase [Agrilactobacillus composti DSM 18527 = JCM 14202]
MKTKLKAILLVLLLLLGLTAGLVPAQTAQGATPNDLNPMNYQASAQAALVLDAKSGQILYAKDANAVLPIASMSKMLSLYLVLQAIQQGKLKWTDTVVPNDAQAALSTNTELSNVPLTAGVAYTVKELYDASWIYSANVAVMLLAQAVAGSQENFVTQMQQQLQKWQITNAKIVNVSGLNNSLLGELSTANTDKNAENEMSAYDVGQVAQHILQDYPEVIDTTKIATETFHANQAGSYPMTNWNLLLPGQKLYDASLAIDGLKTGTSDAAGECFTATLMVNGRRVIAVVMHAAGAVDDKDKRFVATTNLLKAAFNYWKVTTIQKKQPLPENQALKVNDGVQKRVALVFAKAQSLWVPKNNGDLSGQLQLAKPYQKGINAPVKAQQTIGRYTLAAPMIFMQPKAAVVQTKQAVTKLPWYKLAFNHIVNIFTK